MKTSNIQTSHNGAIIRGWVDGAMLVDAGGGGGTIGEVQNGAGIDLGAGDVVELALDGTIVLATAASDPGRIGVVLDDIAWGEFGPVAWKGPVPLVTVDAAVVVGHYGEMSGTAGQATDVGTTPTATSFVLFTGSGTSPSGFLLGGSGVGSGFELNTEGGQSVISVHGAMGSTETFDPADGNVHTGTLDANCVFTLTAPTGSGAATLELWITGSGTRTWTWPGSVTWDGGVTGDPPADTLTVRVILETIDGGTNWIANMVGGGAAAATTRWELAVVPGSPPDSLYADGDWLYIEVPI